MSDQESFSEKVERLKREIAERQAELASLVLGDPRISVSGRGPCPTCNAAGYVKEPLHPFPNDGATRWKRCPDCLSYGSLLANSLTNANMSVDEYWSNRGSQS